MLVLVPIAAAVVLVGLMVVFDIRGAAATIVEFDRRQKARQLAGPRIRVLTTNAARALGGIVVVFGVLLGALGLSAT